MDHPLRVKLKRKLTEEQGEKLIELVTDAEMRNMVTVLVQTIADHQTGIAGNQSVLPGRENEILFTLARAEGARQVASMLKELLKAPKEEK